MRPLVLQYTGQTSAFIPGPRYIGGHPPELVSDDPLLLRSLEGPFLPVDHVGFTPSPTLCGFTDRSTTPRHRHPYSIAEHSSSRRRVDASPGGYPICSGARCVPGAVTAPEHESFYRPGPPLMPLYRHAPVRSWPGRCARFRRDAAPPSERTPRRSTCHRYR